MDTLLLAIRLVVGGLLMSSGYSKLVAGRPLVLRLVEGYDLLNPGLARYWAAALPIVEMTFGAALVVGLFGRATAFLAQALFAVLTLAAASVLIRGKKADCGCFGKNLSRQITWTIVARNLVLIAALSAVAFYGSGVLAIDAFHSLRLWAALLLAIGLGLTPAHIRAHSKEAKT